jgi:hypothetical protein
MSDKRSITSKISIQKARLTRQKNQEEKSKLLEEISKHDKLVIEKYGVNTYITRRLANIETMIVALSNKLDRIEKIKLEETDNGKFGLILNELKSISLDLMKKEVQKEKIPERKKLKTGGNAITQALYEMNRKYM